MKDIREGRIERVCLASDAEFLKRITEKQMGILESLHENQSKMNILFGNFEDAERVPCSFGDRKVERNPKQKEAVEFSVGVKDLFLIWGPPGTGKSTIVPEIIRNYLSRESDAKILVCSYANRAVDRIVEIICNDEKLRQKSVRVGPSQIKAEYKDVKLVEIINNVFEGVRNRIKNLIERWKELDKEEREHVDDARGRIRDRILALEKEIGASKEERESLENHKVRIENEISECEDAITMLRDKEVILDGKIASHEEEKEKIKNLSEIVEVYLGFTESMIPWLRRRNFRRDQRYISHRSMIERVNLENMTRDELRRLEKLNQEKMEEVKHSLSELRSSLEGVREEIMGREKGIDEKRRKLKAVEKEIKAKKKKESYLGDEKAKLEGSLNAEAEETFSAIRRLNIIAEDRFKTLKRIINGIKAERREINWELKSLKERISNVRDQEKEILNGKQIIATTNLKVLTSTFDDLHFDLAIMDEAGFTDLPAALGPFIKASKIILIGDHKQLQPIIWHDDEEIKKKYLFSVEERFERDLNEGSISRGLRSIFRRKGISISEDAVITRRRGEDKWEIADYRDGETYSIEKERGELKIYKKARIPMWCDWYLSDCDIYVEYWGMMEDASYRRTREEKIREYNRLQLKLLSIERDDLDNLDEKLRDKLQDLGVSIPLT